MIVSDANDVDDGNDYDVKDLVNLLNNTKLDKPAESASAKVEEAKEIFNLECSKHIDMARAQRFLYQSLEAAAVCNVKNGVEYLKRKTILTVDFGQTIQVLCYNSEQPGCLYYYTPMTANNFRIVNYYHNYGNGNRQSYVLPCLSQRGWKERQNYHVGSLIVVETLCEMKLPRDNDVDGELNIIFDNCSG